MLRVLCVEDVALVAFTLEEMLLDLGYEPIVVCSAEEALGLVRDGVRADILVTDIWLPGMKGVELAGELTRMIPGLAVVFATGALTELPDEIGIVLHKPHSAEQLDKAIKTALNGA